MTILLQAPGSGTFSWPGAASPAAAEKSANGATNSAASSTIKSSSGEDVQIDNIIDLFAKSEERYGKELEAINEIQRRHQAAMGDLYVISGALANYRAKHPNGGGQVDLRNVEVIVPPGSPYASEATKSADGKLLLGLGKLMDHYQDEHPELGLPAVPTTDAELDAYFERINSAFILVLEPQNQANQREITRITDSRRLLEEMLAKVISTLCEMRSGFLKNV